MKGLFVYITFVCLISLPCVAQNPLPFVEEGKTWTILDKYTYGSICDPNHGIYEYYKTEYHQYTIKGDTLIAGKTYKKIYDYCVTHYEYGTVEVCPKDSLASFAIREEGGKVYHYHYGNKNEEEHLWFDFNLKGEEEFPVNGIPYTYGTWACVVEGVDAWDGVDAWKPYPDKFWFDDANRRCWTVRFYSLENKEDWFREKVVEGVGSPELGLLDVFNGYDIVGVVGPGIISVHDGSGKLIFGTDIREKINDLVTGIAPITTDQPAAAAIYDLSGRRLLQAPSQGFYIQGGKKRLAR